MHILIPKGIFRTDQIDLNLSRLYILGQNIQLYFILLYLVTKSFFWYFSMVSFKKVELGTLCNFKKIENAVSQLNASTYEVQTSRFQTSLGEASKLYMSPKFPEGGRVSEAGPWTICTFSISSIRF